MKTKILIAAIGALISMNASALDLSDYLDSQYGISWANQTEFPEVVGAEFPSVLANYDTEGNSQFLEDGSHVRSSVVDIASMEIVGKSNRRVEAPLFVETYE